MGTGPGRGGPIPDKRDEERLSIVRSLWWTHRDGIFISLCAIVSAVQDTSFANANSSELF